ncbi:hypothetical protein SEA_TEATEALATTE_77 [Gordonia phage Teatealatte]|uniref:Uncharacterized protein n=2 Tax=Demosthenesvirus katyusha TaxID=1982108 RepID=A0A345MCB3_9CAUD|nr:hypothetical protein SEA_TEATEALATTE_77 [Gordonia phage Teatealatte]QBP29632.1 hypothetical protein SEA_TREDGE_76 [Gordonia phage Tredge]
MSTKKTRKRRNTGGFGFLSRAQLLEAKCKRLARELQSWVEADGDADDEALLKQQTTLVEEIYALEPQVRFEEGRIYPAVVAFDLVREGEDSKGVEQAMTVPSVAIGAALLMSDDNGQHAAKWFVAPTLEDHPESGFTWPELMRYISLAGLNSLEVLR